MMVRQPPVKVLGLVLLANAFGAFALLPALHLLDHHDDHTHVGSSIVFHHPGTPGPEDSDSEPSEERPTTHQGQGAGHLGLLVVFVDAPEPVRPPGPLVAAVDSAQPWTPSFSRPVGWHARAPPERGTFS